jgi:hypothetical protein
MRFFIRLSPVADASSIGALASCHLSTIDTSPLFFRKLPNPTQPSQPDMRIFLVMLWIMHVWTAAAKTTSQL